MKTITVQYVDRNTKKVFNTITIEHDENLDEEWKDESVKELVYIDDRLTEQEFNYPNLLAPIK